MFSFDTKKKRSKEPCSLLDKAEYNIFESNNLSLFDPTDTNALSTNQTHGNSLFPKPQAQSSTILISDRSEDAMLDTFTRQLNLTPQKTFKKDSFHLVQTDKNNQNITTHLQLKHKPSERHPSIVKVIPNVNQEFKIQQGESRKDAKQELVQAITNYLKAKGEFQLDFKRLGKRLLTQRLEVYRLRLLEKFERNKAYMSKEAALKNDIDNLKGEISKGSINSVENPSSLFSFSSNAGKVIIDHLEEEFGKYKSILSSPRVEEAKLLNQRCQALQKRNQQMSKSLLESSLKAAKPDTTNQQSEKKKEYLQKMEHLRAQINVEKGKYDRLKNRPHMELKLERLSSLTADGLEVVVHQHYTFRNLMGLFLFLVGLVTALAYRYYF